MTPYFPSVLGMAGGRNNDHINDLCLFYETKSTTEVVYLHSHGQMIYSVIILWHVYALGLALHAKFLVS